MGSMAEQQQQEQEQEEDWRALPAQLQQLLLDLAQNAVSDLPYDLDNIDKYGGYFGDGDGGRDSDEGRQWRVRKRVLTAIANCRSLYMIDIPSRWKIGVDREDEVSLLLGGLASNPSLESLYVSYCEGFGRQAACEALGQLVASSRSLLSLYLYRVGLDAAGLGALAKGFNKDSVLEELDLEGNKVGDAEGAQHLARILATAPRLKTLRLRLISMDVAGAQLIANALPLCATLRELRLSTSDAGVVEHSSPSAGGLGPMSTVLKLAFTRSHHNATVSGVTQLVLDIKMDGEAGLADALAGMLRTNDCIQTLLTSPYALIHGLYGLRHNSTIWKLTLLEDSGSCETKVWMHLVPLLQECKALRVLDLAQYLHGHASFKKELLRSLEGNASLNELDISDWDDLNDDLFRDLMKSLQVNRTLRKIHIANTTWVRDGKDAIIDAALARNATQEAYLPLLLDGQMPVMPKAGRLFLCGAPFAGKTTLRTNMIKAWQQQTTTTTASPQPLHLQQTTTPSPQPLQLQPVRGTIWTVFSHFLEILISMCSGSGTVTRPEGIETEVLRNDTGTRTEGIEVEVLRKDDDMQVTIWDLAGQAEYRALQDYLFPSNNQACVFLFAFNAFDAQQPETLQRSDGDKMLQDKFRNSFKFWLRFINSNCRNVGSTLPRIFVVVTHKDQMEDLDAEILPNLLQPILTQLALDFKQVVHVTTEPLFFMDARSPDTVEPLLEELFKSFQDLFTTRLFWVPEVCNRLSAVLTAWVSQHPTQPIVKKQQLQTMFQNELYSFQSCDDKELFAAILAYLHDVGNVIRFKDLDVVVVNPHWISHTFLGRLIQLLSGPSTSSLGRSSDGFVAERLLHATLGDILKGTQADGIDGHNLVSLMKTLNLCYEADKNRGTGFFVPFTLDDGNGKALRGERQLAWNGDTACNYNYVGRRLQCRDERKTFLGPGFFPRFQVNLRKSLLTRIYGMQSHQYSIGRNLINFKCDGMDVFLESSGDIGEDTGDIGDRVDILIRSRRSKDQTFEFLQKHVLAELKAFCASPEGSPGVELMESIIRTECVVKLTPCLYRQNQSVLTQTLMKCLLENQKSFPGQISSAGFLWHWPAMPEAHLPDDFEEARDLLSSGEVQNVLPECRARPSLPVTVTGDPSIGTSHSQPSPQVKSVQQLQYANERVKAGNRRGLAMVVSIEEDRLGGAVDRGRLEALLKNLKFDTDIVVDDPEDVKSSLRQLVLVPDLADDNCFLYCINVHGGTEEDGRQYVWLSGAQKLYVLDDIVKPIAECSYLANKPKVFVINACRGTGSLVTSSKAQGSGTGSLVTSNRAEGSEAQESPVVSNRVRPLYSASDCLVVFSISPGEESFRDVEKGTNWIVALMEAISEGSQTEDVLSILTSAIGKVTDMEVYCLDTVWMNMFPLSDQPKLAGAGCP